MPVGDCGEWQSSFPAVVAERLSLKKRKLMETLSVINACSADLAEKRRACEEPLQQIKDNLAALPVFVFICNI